MNMEVVPVLRTLSDTQISASSTQSLGVERPTFRSLVKPQSLPPNPHMKNGRGSRHIPRLFVRACENWTQRKPVLSSPRPKISE